MFESEVSNLGENWKIILRVQKNIRTHEDRWKQKFAPPQPTAMANKKKTKKASKGPAPSTTRSTRSTTKATKPVNTASPESTEPVASSAHLNGMFPLTLIVPQLMRHTQQCSRREREERRIRQNRAEGLHLRKVGQYLVALSFTGAEHSRLRATHFQFVKPCH